MVDDKIIGHAKSQNFIILFHTLVIKIETQNLAYETASMSSECPNFLKILRI